MKSCWWLRSEVFFGAALSVTAMVHAQPAPAVATAAPTAEHAAGKKIDHAVRLKRLVESTPEPNLDLTPPAEAETVTRLGPNVAAHLKFKVDLINGHSGGNDCVFISNR